MTDLWEKCTRLMLLWTEDELESFLSIMLKISAAIFAHPEDLKYQRLKFSNRLVSEKINARTGGKEYMLAMGFNVEIDDGDKKEGDSGGVGGAVGGEKVYVLRPDGLDGLAASVDWLSETVGVCLGLIEKKKKNSSATSARSGTEAMYAAACLIQIKLPTGASVQGGFMGSDQVADVTSFAQHCFVQDRHDKVVLRLPHSAQALSADSTLADLHLLPRALLLACTLSAAARDASLKQAHVQAVVHEAEKAVHQQKSKQDKKKEHEERERHKADILRAFREDHEPPPRSR